MRVVVDTNILISALLAGRSLPARVIDLWRDGRITLVTSHEQIDEMMRVTRYPKIRARLSPALAGRLINELRDLAVVVEHLPEVEASPDPFDNYLLATAIAGAAQYLVSGDKRDLLSLGSCQGVQIIELRTFLARMRYLP
jgi:putative PIN family toxin of toxin-antitoxin system